MKKFAVLLLPIAMLTVGAYLIGGPVNAGWTLCLSGAVWLLFWLADIIA